MHLLQLMLIAACAVEGLLIVRLFALRLQWDYRWFTVFLVYSVSMGGLAAIAGTNSPIYCHAFWVSRPVNMLLKFLIVGDLFGNLYARHRGLRWLSHLPVAGSAFAGVAVATSTFYAFAQVRGACSDLGCLYSRFLEFRTFALAALVIFMVALLYQTQSMVNVGWNACVHAIVLTVLMSSQLLAELLHLLPANRSEQLQISLNIWLTAIHILCIVMWCVLLRSEPEDESPRLFEPVPASPDALLRLTAVLDSLSEAASIGIRRRIAYIEGPIKGGGQVWRRQ